MMTVCLSVQLEAELVAQQASAGTTAMQSALDGFEPRKRPFSPPPGSAPLQRFSPTAVSPLPLPALQMLQRCLKDWCCEASIVFIFMLVVVLFKYCTRSDRIGKDEHIRASTAYPHSNLPCESHHSAAQRFICYSCRSI